MYAMQEGGILQQGLSKTSLENTQGDLPCSSSSFLIDGASFFFVGSSSGELGRLILLFVGGC